RTSFLHIMSESSDLEKSIDDTCCRVSVIVGGVQFRKRLQSFSVLFRHRRCSVDFVDPGFPRCDHRSRQLRFIVEVEAAQFVSIILEIVGEEDDWTLEHRIVEEGGGIVGDEHVTGKEEFVDVRESADIDDVRLQRLRYLELRIDEEVCAHEEGDVVPETAGELFRSKWPLEGEAASGRGLIIAEGRCVKHNGAFVRYRETIPHAGPDLICVWAP